MAERRNAYQPLRLVRGVRPRAWWDLAEARLARASAKLATPRGYLTASAGLVLLALLVRLPLIVRATDVWAGHPDSWVYFHQAYAEYLRGNLFPDGHRGSGWQLLLFGTLWLLGHAPGEGWTPYGTEMTGGAAQAALVAHALSACLSVGAVAATLLLARELLPPRAALLAGALVALDPYLLRLSTSALSEPLYIPIFILATLTILRARRQRAWLLATGALMAIAHVLKVNGLVMFAALGVWAWLLFTRDGKGAKEAQRAKDRGWTWLGLTARDVRWGLAAGATFLLVASPYLAWRADALSGPFDYGTNQRYWADDLWDLDDAWWSGYTPEGGGENEGVRDYFATHTARDAALRLWQSFEWQVFDLFGSGRWPAQEQEGGAWVGTAPEESALTPLLAGLALVAGFTVLRRREWWFLPVTLVFTLATFLWIYPLVRSVRYFSPFIPFFALAAVAGWMHLATLVKRPYLATVLVFAAYFLLYAGVPLLNVPRGLGVLASSDVRALVLVLTSLWLALALAPAWPTIVSRVRRTRGERTEEAEPPG